MKLDSSLLTSQWQTLAPLQENPWVDQRIQLHWATQSAASAGFSLLKPPADWSHTSLGYQPSLQGLVGASLPGGQQTALCFNVDKAPAIAVLNPQGLVENTFALQGKTLPQAYAWVAAQLKLGADALKPPIEEMPPHGVGQETPFAFQPAQTAQAGGWFSNGHQALCLVKEQAETWAFAVGDVRCWPHHFDMATLITLNDEPDPEKAKSINVGFSPGDGNYPLPYWYVSPWPHPPSGEPLPSLQGGGCWHTQGFSAAVLTCQAATTGDASQQAQNLSSFLVSAIDGCREVI